MIDAVLVGVPVVVAIAGAVWLVVDGLRWRRVVQGSGRCELCPADHVGFPGPGNGFLCEACFESGPWACRVCRCSGPDWPELSAHGCTWVQDPFDLGHLCSVCEPAEAQLLAALNEALR